jgi:hypothetical protein
MVGWYLYGQFAVFEANDPYIWVRTRGFAILCLVIAAAHVILLGIPAYLLLRWRDAVRWWSTILSGFVLGATPIAILAWPLRYAQPGSSASFDGISTMVDGVPTMAGWTQYLSGLAFFGALGAGGACAFWLIWRMRPNTSFKVTPDSAPQLDR